MYSITEVNILEYIEAGSDQLHPLLLSFSNPLNKDVQDFLHFRAIDFATQRISITFLLFAEEAKSVHLAGYYTLTNKVVSIPRNQLSKTAQKRIGKFCQKDTENNRFLLSMPLIAQLGKNFSYTNPAITGSVILEAACNRVRQAERLIGGKMTYIECAPHPKLLRFYTSNGFTKFWETEDLQSPNAEKTLVQMFKYF